MKEQLLVNWTINYLLNRGHHAWRNNSGVLPITSKGKSRMIKIGQKGLPDVLGYHKETGRLIAIECKVGRNKLSPAQEERIEHMKACNVLAFVVYTTDEVQELPI